MSKTNITFDSGIAARMVLDLKVLEKMGIFVPKTFQELVGQLASEQRSAIESATKEHDENIKFAHESYAKACGELFDVVVNLVNKNRNKAQDGQEIQRVVDIFNESSRVSKGSFSNLKGSYSDEKAAKAVSLKMCEIIDPIENHIAVLAKLLRENGNVDGSLISPLDDCLFSMVEWN